MSLEALASQQIETLAETKEPKEKQEAKQRLNMFFRGLSAGESPDTAVLRWELDEKQRELEKLSEEEDSVQKSERFKKLMNNISSLRKDLFNMEQYARHMERQTQDDRERVSRAWAEEGLREQAFNEEDKKRFVDFVVSQTLKDVEGGPPPRAMPRMKQTLLEQVLRRPKTQEQLLQELSERTQQGT